MIKKYLYLTICILFFLGAKAQDEFIFPSMNNEFQRDKVVLSLSLLSQLDFNSPALSFGLDLRATDWFGVHQELGFVNNWLNPFYAIIDQSYSDNNKFKNGVKYVLEPRFYPFKKDRLVSSAMFFAPSFDFRYVNINRNNEWVSRFNGSYNQKMNFAITKFAYGGQFRFGFSTGLKKFMPIDLVFGLGARYAVKSNNLPQDAEPLNNSMGFLFTRTEISGSMWHPSASFAMMLHLPFKK